MDHPAPGADELAACNRALQTMGGFYRVDCGQPGGFRGRIRSMRVGPVVLADVSLGRCIVRRDFAGCSGTLDHYNLVLQFEGNARMRQCGSEALLLPGDLTLIDSRHMSEFEAREAIHQYSVGIPASPLRELFGGERVPLARTISGSTGAGRLLADIVTSCCRNAADLRGLDLVATTLHVLAAAVGRVPPLARAGTGRRANRSEIEQFIDANIERYELSPRLVARHFGLSERQLYRVTATLGCTPAALIWSRRLQHARRLLDREPGSVRVLDVALRCGFKDGAHFSRAFRRTFGHSPSESRPGF